MNLEKLNPWNWFRHEEGGGAAAAASLPVTRTESNWPSAGVPVLTPLTRLQREIDRLFDDAFSGFGLTPGNWLKDRELGNNALFRPSVDVAGDDRHYEITLDVPGVKEQDLTIEVRGDVLTVKGQKEERREQKDQQFYRIERSYGAFQRTLALPEDANVDDITATLNDGVLKLQIPRRELPGAQAKRIRIGSG